MNNLNKLLSENMAKSQGGNMIKYNEKTKCCAACNYWDGARHFTPDQKFVQVEDKNVEGKCFGHCKPFMKKAKDYCPGWAKDHLFEKSISEILLSIDEVLGKTDKTAHLKKNKSC